MADDIWSLSICLTARPGKDKTTMSSLCCVMRWQMAPRSHWPYLPFPTASKNSFSTCSTIKHKQHQNHRSSVFILPDHHPPPPASQQTMADNNSQSQQPHAQGGGGGGGGGHHRQHHGRRPPIHPMRFAALSKITQRSMVARYSPTQKSLERNLRARLGHASVFGAVAAATAAATTADNNSSDDDAGNENINENSGRMVAGRAFKDLDSIWRIPLPAMTLPLKAPQHHKVIGSLDTLSNGTTVLEQGIIHFGIQGPLGAPKHRFDPCKVWSYLVIGPDNGEPNNVRLLAFNKMVPTDSGRDPWLGFVKDTGVSIEQVKQQFLQTSNSYKKVSMLGDGFYTITNTGQDTQFSYMFARPEVLDSDDRDDVAFVKGSWIMSIQSPHYARFNYATLREPVPFSKEVSYQNDG